MNKYFLYLFAVVFVISHFRGKNPFTPNSSRAGAQTDLTDSTVIRKTMSIY